MSTVLYRAAEGLGTSESLQVRARVDGVWGDWAEVSVRTANRAPTLTVDATVTVSRGGWRKLEDVLSVSDADGDPVRQLTLFGRADDASGFRFYSADAGFLAVGEEVTVPAADLSRLWIKAPAAAGSGGLFVKASDGTTWSAWSDVAPTLPNSAPTVAATRPTVAARSWVRLDSVFSFADADGNAPQRVEVADTSGAGRLWFRQTYYDTTDAVALAADRLAGVYWQAGAQAGSDTLRARVHDGMAWSDWRETTILTA